MSEPKDERTLRSRATRRLMDTASDLVTRARLKACDLSDRGEPRPATAADVLIMESQHAAYVHLHRHFTERAGRGVAAGRPRGPHPR